MLFTTRLARRDGGYGQTAGTLPERNKHRGGEVHIYDDGTKKGRPKTTRRYAAGNTTQVLWCQEGGYGRNEAKEVEQRANGGAKDGTETGTETLRNS